MRTPVSGDVRESELTKLQRQLNIAEVEAARVKKELATAMAVKAATSGTTTKKKK